MRSRRSDLDPHGEPELTRSKDMNANVASEQSRVLPVLTRELKAKGWRDTADKDVDFSFLHFRDLALRLGRARQREQLLHEVFAGLSELLPHRRIVLQSFARDTQQTARLWSFPREPEGPLVSLSEDASEDDALLVAALSRAGLTRSASYLPRFADSRAGFDLLLDDGKLPCALLALEYDEEGPSVERDRRFLRGFALHLRALLAALAERERAEEAELWLHALREEVEIPLFSLTPEGVLGRVNSAFAKLLELPSESLVGQRLVHFLTPGCRELFSALLLRLREGQRAAIDEPMQLVRSSGSPITLDVHFVSLPRRGSKHELLGIGRDRSEVRYLEEQIIQAEKLATLGQLAAGVVHELNNPLTSITVYGEYLLRKASSSASLETEKLQRIVEAAERMLRFTRDLVTYARPSTDPPRRLTLHEVLDQSIVFCEHIIDAYGIRIDKNYGDTAAQVYGVKDQLQQVFINLITNACHAMQGRSGVLHIQTSVEEAFFRIDIQDNGEGIPLVNQERIFEPFFSTKGEGKGTGLGLSIVKNIIQQHNGHVELNSDVGKGSIFSIYLPQSHP